MLIDKMWHCEYVIFLRAKLVVIFIRKADEHYFDDLAQEIVIRIQMPFPDKRPG